MVTTVNISLPKQLYKDAKKLVAEGKYSSISEIMRAGLRRVLYDADKITENGFPGWFEDQVLESAAQPVKKDVVLNTQEDVDKFFKNPHKRIEKKRQMKYDKNSTNWQVQPATR